MTKKAQNNKSSVTGEFINGKKGNNSNFNRPKPKKLNLKLDMQDYRRLYPYSIFDIEFTDKINSVHDEIRKRFSYLIFNNREIRRLEHEETEAKKIAGYDVSYACALLDFICAFYLHDERNASYFSCKRELRNIGNVIEGLIAILDDKQAFKNCVNPEGAIAKSFYSYHLTNYVKWASENNKLDWLRTSWLSAICQILSKEELIIKRKLNDQKENISDSYVLSKRCMEQIALIDHNKQDNNNSIINKSKDNDDHKISLRSLKITKWIPAVDVAKKFLMEYDFNDIYEQLDKYVCGQEEAKRAVTVLIRNHMQAIANPKAELRKENLLLIGPSGCGKTELLRAARKFFPFPILEVNCAASAPSGWKGASIGNLLRLETSLLYEKGGKENKDKITEQINCSLVFIDEADKMFWSSGERRDEAYVKSHQSDFLKLVESGKATDEDGCLVFNGDHVSFFFAGVFGNLLKDEEIHVNKELCKKLKTNNDLFQSLIDNGVEPEFLGRIGNIVQLEPLSNESIIKILKGYPSSTIKDAAKKFELSGKKLKVTEGAYVELANYANESGMGLRGTCGLLNRALQRSYFEKKSKEVKLTSKMLKESI